MTRGVRVCSEPGCGQFKPCPVPGHTPTPWEGSTRKNRLPPDWQRRRRNVLRRDRGICHVCGQAGADEVDHVIPGDDHSLGNLAAIHHDPCHLQKSLAEAREARERNRP